MVDAFRGREATLHKTGQSHGKCRVSMLYCHCLYGSGCKHSLVARANISHGSNHRGKVGWVRTMTRIEALYNAGDLMSRKVL